MKLHDFLRIKKWNSAVFSRECGVKFPVIRKILLGTGSINLDTALKICQATGGMVTPWDLSCNAEAIANGTFTRDHKKQEKEFSEETEVQMKLSDFEKALLVPGKTVELKKPITEDYETMMKKMGEHVVHQLKTNFPAESEKPIETIEEKV